MTTTLHTQGRATMAKRAKPPAERQRRPDTPDRVPKYLQLAPGDATALHRVAAMRFGGIETQVIRIAVRLAEAIYSHPATVAALTPREALDAYAVARAAELAAGDGVPDADPLARKD